MSSRTTAHTPTDTYGMILIGASLGITELEIVGSTAVTDKYSGDEVELKFFKDDDVTLEDGSDSITVVIIFKSRMLRQ